MRVCVWRVCVWPKVTDQQKTNLTPNELVSHYRGRGGEPTATQTKNQTKVNLTLAPKKHLQLIKIEWRDL